MRALTKWLMAGALCTAGLVLAQQTPGGPVQVADDGTVIAAHRTIHRHRGETVTWARQAQGQNAWYVRFAESPCQPGVSEFGNGRASTCTISVPCARRGDAACKTYHYTSALTANGPQHDPDIVVDPDGVQ